MEENYLVILGSHVDSEKKRDVVIETLKHFKEENIDVCLLSHCSDYLSDLSDFCKFVIYDNNNEYLTLQDYLDNVSSIPNDTAFKYNANTIYYYHSFGETMINIPASPHSKSALSLLRNGIITSNYNNYTWTIYLEYDLPIPEKGFKSFIEKHIQELKDHDKKFFYYRNTTNGCNFLWGGFIIFDTESIFNSNKLLKTKWYKSKKEWIKTWYLGFFESIIENTLIDEFSSDNILHKDLINHFKNFWDIDDYHKLSRFRFEQTYYKYNPNFVDKVNIKIYPFLDEDKFKIFLYYFNNLNKKIIIKKLLLYTQKTLLKNINDVYLDSNTWFYEIFDINNLSVDDYIQLECVYGTENEDITFTQKISIKDFNEIHDKIMKVNLKNE